MSVSDDTAPTSEAMPYGRRAFVGIVAGGVSSLLWGDAALRGISDLLRPVTSQLPDGISAALPSPSSGWRIYNVAPPMPRFDQSSWRLTIDGLVDRPQSIDFDQLRALPRAEQTSDFHCVTGWSVEGVRWAGVRFPDLLEAAGVRAEAGALTFSSAEKPYTDALTLDQAMTSDAMLAYEMDGGPISREHGAPVRLVMPQMYGYKGVKWVERITATAQPELGFWEQRGYDLDAWVGASNGR